MHQIDFEQAHRAFLCVYVCVFPNRYKSFHLYITKYSEIDEFILLAIDFGIFWTKHRNVRLQIQASISKEHRQ